MFAGISMRLFEGMRVRHSAEKITGAIDAISVMADGLAIVRIEDRWFPADELVAV